MLRNLLVCLSVILITTGCSSSGTNAGIGLNLAGQWRGVIRSTGSGQSATMNISFTQAAAGATFTGVATFGPGACMTGGTVEGTMSGAAINFTVSSSSSTMNMNGTFQSENALSGLWSNEEVASSSGSESSSDEITARSSSDFTLATACAGESGTWSLNR